MSHTGEKSLEKLLASMSPELLDGEFVFCTLKSAHYGEHTDLEPVAAIAEVEGLTLVVPKSKADGNQLRYDSIFRCITLRIHSSLDAVGLTSAVSSKLTERGISANIIAGYYHDHIFVPSNHATIAVEALGEFTSQ